MLPQRLFWPMNKFLFYLFLLLSVTQARAGVVIGGTRFIYSAQMPTLSIPVSNTSADDWLIDSHIQSAQRWPGAAIAPVSKPPFIITPPLFRLAAGQENTLRVTWTGVRLPADRESLFTLSIAAIPSGKPGVNSVQMAFRSALKFIYRPTGLTGNAQQAYRQLRWSLMPDGLTVQNPGPYYVTLFLLNVNGNPVDAAGVVAPFSTRKTTWCRRATRCAVRWQSINDYGRVLSPVTANVQLSRHPFYPLQ
ncbi:putative fimbrial chaperone YcbF [Klebsiella spallanzanii]|uniref:Fimbrial chaperone YcbF n=2 Tax=Klebsiella spallanzanii TaxID=2587528 RepID=A0ABY6VA08_9ENTR|nr:pili/flagellar-assembly chaperone [Klebsiella spallanzanii]VUS36548.1 putative fimbrial chaperone YcbF [Klebsiella spallanzanii]